MGATNPHLLIVDDDERARYSLLRKVSGAVRVFSDEGAAHAHSGRACLI
jgi:hypothetical protein